MSLTNPNTPVSQQDLQDFYHKILPYMGGSSEGGGGHTIEDSEGTDLTQRDTLQFGEGFKAEDDSTNEKTVISPDVMQSGDMSDVITPLPSVAPRKEGIKYSTTEQVIGEWIDGKPLYQKTIYVSSLAGTYWVEGNHGIADVDFIRCVEFTPVHINNNDFDFSQMNINTNNTYWDEKRSIILNYVSRTKYEIFIGSEINSSYSCYMTLQYTKTTDTAE